MELVCQEKVSASDKHDSQKGNAMPDVDTVSSPVGLLSYILPLPTQG